ncbi:hypothetical protein QWA68_008650 [Fusarium oxysporum]|nr:hypothetical protein QWA68_008650 [Fusarium oxysporum]
MSQHPIYDWCLDVTTTMSQPEETNGAQDVPMSPVTVTPSSLTPHFRPITTTTTLDWELRLAACICVCISPTDSKEIPGLGPGPGPELSAFCFSFFFFTLLPTLLPPHSPDPSTADYRSINSSVLRSPLST